MRNIDKFILHVAHNWRNELNEAYSEGAIRKFIEKFREEADDLNVNISDDQLKKYIERFDTLKNSPKVTEKDLDKWSLAPLIKLVTASPGAESSDDEEDQTPDVVYNEDGKTIWNGSKEGNCINYGRGEKWCITRGSFSGYRYSKDRGYPTFYLAKNNNLPSSDKLSFVAIQVRDTPDEQRKYVYTNRNNSPYESSPMSFGKLMSEVPWLNDIPNIRSILRYIPLSRQEKITQQYSREAASIREWIKFPFETKKQYLVIRKDNTLFNDITNEDFVSKYLPQYPQMAEFIATTPGVINNISLLSNLDKFSNQDRRSITANIQQPINTKYLSSEALPFDIKKLLVILNKWDLSPNERLYTTKDGSTIVTLNLGDNISIGLYQAEDDYPNVKLNKRTSKYLTEYPDLDKIPFNIMIKLVTDGIIDKEFIGKVIEKAKSEENSAIIVKKVEDGEILVDANSFSSYKIKNGNITKIPFTDEEVQTALGDEKENTAFQQSAVNMIKQSIEDRTNIPPTLDKDAFVSIIKSTPYSKRTFTTDNTIGQQILLVPDGESRFTLFTKSIENLYNFYADKDYGNNSDWTNIDSNDWMDEGAWRAYFAYLRNENRFYEGSRLAPWFRGSSTNTECKKNWFSAQPPLSPTDPYAIAVTNDNYYVVNKANPRESLKLADSGKLTKANIPASMAAQLLRTTPAAQGEPAVAAPQAPADQVVRRGRPVGIPNVPRAEQPAAAGGGDINVPEVMDETGLRGAFISLPRADNRRLTVTNGVRVNPNGDRGAARRNNQLGAAGTVGRVIAVGPSKIYIIRLANQQIIASINIQPGNRNYILLPNGTMVTLNSPAELMSALRQRNLAEVRHYMVRDYVSNNPHHLDEVRELMKQHEAKRK